MKNYFFLLMAVTMLHLNSCKENNVQKPTAQNAESAAQATTISAEDFDAKIKSTPSATVVDVRTPEEFANGHLINAVNYDWNGDAFEQQVAKLDKSKPVLVYCLSGARSAAAAEKMRASGFKEVYELEGGVMKWRGKNLPETTENQSAHKGLTMEQYNAILKSDKTVLVDFYADWCAPCKKMEPYLKEIAAERKADVEVVRINADDNQALLKELKIDALPVLRVYKNGNLTWSNIGFIDKAGVLERLK